MKKDISMAALIQWVYGAQKAHLAIDQGRGMLPDERRADGRIVRAVSGCGVARCMDNSVLGTEIDYFGPDQGSLHPDAEEVHDLVRGAVDLGICDYPQVGQIIHYGQTGVCPDWMPDARPRLQRVRDGKGRPVMMYRNQEDKRRRRHPYACEIQIILTPQQIAIAHDLYHRWWNAIEMLKIYYQDNSLTLKDYQVVSVGVASAPWQKDIDMCISI